MARAVLDMAYQALPLAEIFDDKPDNLYIRFFVIAADIVNLANAAFLQNSENPLTMVLYMEPVADLHTIAVNRQFFIILAIIYHERDKFFRELIRAVII